jgi:hypothetical protein
MSTTDHEEESMAHDIMLGFGGGVLGSQMAVIAYLLLTKQPRNLWPLVVVQVALGALLMACA